MDKIEHILDSIEYIEENIRTNIKVADAARAAGYSLYYYTREFNRIAKLSPNTYIQSRRMALAAKELASGNQKVIDIAYDFGFNSPEVFSRACKRILGATPFDIKKGLPYHGKVLYKAFCYGYLRHINNGTYLTPKFEAMDELCIIGVPSSYTANVRQMLLSNPDHGNQPGKTLYGLKFDNGIYMLGPLSSTGSLTPGLYVQKSIPTGDYAKFVHKGKTKDIEHSYYYIYHTWLPRFKFALAESYTIEVFGDSFMGPGNPQSEIEIYLPINK